MGCFVPLETTSAKMVAFQSLNTTVTPTSRNPTSNGKRGILGSLRVFRQGQDLNDEKTPNESSLTRLLDVWLRYFESNIVSMFRYLDADAPDPRGPRDAIEGVYMAFDSIRKGYFKGTHCLVQGACEVGSALINDVTQADAR